ncbi:MAG: PD40 domain-containing protein [Kiritimatiellae bacterium]|nr:PD40 domain-containing protein [Kiritimatiellia bacterium]
MIATTCALLAATLLGEGTCGVYSPDGGKIALQCVVDGKSRVGVLDRATGRFAWVEKDAGNAAYPAWSPSGDAIVYSYGNETNSAWAAKGGDTGYHLRIWRRGEGVREITTGRFRDYMPSFSRDGRKIFFVSTRCASPDVFLATRSGVYSVNVDGSELSYLVPSHVNDEGAGQPVVSPDGKLLALAQIANFYLPWRIMCARLDKPEVVCAVSPKGQSAYAPRWTPDGKHIVYTGFSKGDPGWCVYVLNPRTGGVKRICEGRNPDVHPSGALLLYDDGRSLYERPFGADDLPGADEVVVDEESRLYDEPERLIWRSEKPDYPATIPMTDAFRFGADRTFFVRAKVRYTPAASPRFRHFLTGEYEGAKLGFELFIDHGRPKFGARDGDGAYMGAVSDMVLEAGHEYVLTGIRTSSALFIYVEGKSLQEMKFSATYPLDRPIQMEVGPTLSGKDEILLGEVGTGWPANVPHPITRTKFFAGEEAK